MPWPPQVGELLPRCSEPEGIEHRLRSYSLKADHKRGGPKAKGFVSMLGIDLNSIEYLAAVISDEIARIPISKVEPKEADVVGCTVQFRIVGPGRYSHRWAWLTTGWHIDGPGARQRMSTAYLRGRERR